MSREVAISDGVVVGDGRLVLFAGPCAIESEELVRDVAETLVASCRRRSVPLVFKASFDKANRTAIDSFRSIGIDAALKLLGAIRSDLGVPVMTDVHECWQVEWAAEVADVIQIPAFLCRQTDLLLAAASSGRVVNIKKGQFVAPGDLRYAIEKLQHGGCERVLLTERGTSFGYHDLVVDFRGLEIMRELAPTVFDATHSVQSPGGGDGRSSGHREYVAGLARAAVAFGVDALFLETHPEPEAALSDRDTQLTPAAVEETLDICLRIHGVLDRIEAL
ncbi:MAG TPA: 3-deoxy-8-phosphooctulonate synthase [Solirubrobacteraceae bacterium]|nr:3-deoxy-8-phosphooctulonate synthase [Solirubrobacteraceae bacterium]